MYAVNPLRSLLTLAVLATGMVIAPVVTGTDTGRAADAAPGPASTPAIEVTGTGISAYPRFDPGTHLYGIRTTVESTGSVDVSVESTGAITIAGRPAPGGRATVSGLQPGDTIRVEIRHGSELQAYRYVYLDRRFPVLDVTHGAGTPAPGLVLLTFGNFFGFPDYAAAVDANGVPRHVAEIPGAGDFKATPRGTYSIARTTTTPGRTGQRIVELDEHFAPTGSYETVDLVNTDFHDSTLLADGSRLLIASEHNADTGLTDAVIQRVGSSGEVVFQWSSGDHFDDEDTYVPDASEDYAHINSVQLLPDGDYVASFRNMSTVLRIAGSDHDGHRKGDVIWHLGGRHNDFDFVGDDLGGPCAQHTAYVQPNGHLTVFDNGAKADPGGFAPEQRADMCPDPEDPDGARIARPHTRVTEYALDEERHTATLVWEYRPDDHYSVFAGSAQRLANGNTLIGWALTGNPGDSTDVTEVNAAKEIVWELDAGAGFSSYRAAKAPDPDREAPTVTLTRAPAEGAAVEPGSRVPLAFGCADRDVLVSCTSTAPSGFLDTSTPGRKQVRVTAVDLAGNTRTLTRSYLVASHLPDLMGRRGTSRVWKGQDVYGTTTLPAMRLRPGKSGVVRLRVRNNGNSADQFLLRGPRGKHQLRYRYLAGSRDVTAAIVAGRYRTPVLAPGAAFGLRVKITRPRTAHARVNRKLTVRARPVVAPSPVDAVTLRIRAIR